MKNSNNRKAYLAPQLTAVSFRSERGFAATGEFSLLSVWNQGESSRETENMGVRSDWNDNTSNGFWGN